MTKWRQHCGDETQTTTPPDKKTHSSCVITFVGTQDAMSEAGFENVSMQHTWEFRKWMIQSSFAMLPHHGQTVSHAFLVISDHMQTDANVQLTKDDAIECPHFK